MKPKTIRGLQNMNILIIDDEKSFLVSLKKRILAICDRNDYLVSISTTTDPYSVLENELYKHNDIILLDIEMPNLSGLDIASEINKQKGNSDLPYIIFITNRDGLVFTALKEQPYSFIRKSHIEDIEACINRIFAKMKNDDFIYIKSGRTTDRVSLKEIRYIEKEKNYIIFYTEKNQYRERSTIEEKAVQFLPKGFVRPHIGYLINVRYIDEIMPQTVRLIDGTLIPLSKKYRKEVKQKFYEWVVKIR